MCPEDLNVADLQRWDFAVHEYAGEVKLDLEADIHVCAVDSRAPPKSEPPVWNLVQTTPLGVCTEDNARNRRQKDE